MARHYSPISCSESEFSELQRLAGCTDNPRLATRADMVLECIRGTRIKDIADSLGERQATVIKWRDRFVEHGVEGLQNLPRGKAAGVFGEPFRERLRETVLSKPPDGHPYWTGALLAETLDVPLFAVWRYLSKDGIRLLDMRDSSTPEPETEPEPEPENAAERKPVRKTVAVPLQITWDESELDGADLPNLEIIARVHDGNHVILEGAIQLTDKFHGIFSQSTDIAVSDRSICLSIGRPSGNDHLTTQTLEEMNSRSSRRP